MVSIFFRVYGVFRWCFEHSVLLACRAWGLVLVFSNACFSTFLQNKKTEARSTEHDKPRVGAHWREPLKV